MRCQRNSSRGKPPLCLTVAGRVRANRTGSANEQRPVTGAVAAHPPRAAPADLALVSLSLQPTAHEFH